jgi:hypothetical protein
MNTTPKMWWAVDYDNIRDEFKDSFIVKVSHFDNYVEGLRLGLEKALKTRLQAIDTETSDEKLKLGSLFGDEDVKLSLYRSFKSLNDKWITSNIASKNSPSGNPNLFFNIRDKSCTKTRNGIDRGELPLAAHFSFVNRVMGDIGDKAVIDIGVLRDAVENPTMSFYQMIDRIMKENHFNFFPLPSFSNFSNADVFSTETDEGKLEEQLKEMFEPTTRWGCVESGPQFVCMYVGGSSRVLDFNTRGNCPIDQTELNNVNDSIKLINTEGQLNTEWGKSDFTSEDANVTLFRVAYGNQNQSHFKNIRLDQSEFTETQESLMIIDTLAKGGDSAKNTTKGQNLHNLYLTRSYKCEVEAMGNMMIQPMMYFQLDNVPMFNGLYMVLQVKHSIQPNNTSTNFTGVRQPITTVPLVSKAVTAMNIDLGDLVSGVAKEDRGTRTLSGVLDDTQTGRDEPAEGEDNGTTQSDVEIADGDFLIEFSTINVN